MAEYPHYKWMCQGGMLTDYVNLFVLHLPETVSGVAVVDH